MATHREVFDFEDKGFSAIILTETEDLVHFRLNVKNDEEFQRWKELYTGKNNTCFNAKQVYRGHCTKLLHRRFICYHGTPRPVGKKKTYTGCPVTMDVDIRFITEDTVRKDRLMATHPCFVKLKGQHNHFLQSAEALKQLRRPPQLYFRSEHADHWTHLHHKTPILSCLAGCSDHRNADEPHKSTSISFNCAPINSSDTTPAMTFNPEEKLDDDDEYYLNESSSNDSDDNNEGVTYEDPTTLLLTGKTKELMRLLQVYRKNTIDSAVSEERQESSGSRERKADADASAHMEQTVGQHVTSFERRLKEQPPKGQQTIRIDDVTYMNVMTYSEEAALVKHITGSAKINTRLTLEEICHLVCNFCVAVSVTVPPIWKVNPLAAMKWVKGFMRRHQILSHLIPGSKNSRWDNYGEHSYNDDSSVVRENTAGKQVPGLYMFDERNAHSSESIKETIDLDHAYALRPGTKVIIVKCLKGNGLYYSELKKS